MFDGERFNVRNQNDLAVRKQYRIQFANSFQALENLSVEDDINRAVKNNIENI